MLCIHVCYLSSCTHTYMHAVYSCRTPMHKGIRLLAPRSLARMQKHGASVNYLSYWHHFAEQMHMPMFLHESSFKMTAPVYILGTLS